MAIHSRILPGESHGQRNLAGYSPWGRTVGHDLSKLAHGWRALGFPGWVWIDQSKAERVRLWQAYLRITWGGGVCFWEVGENAYSLRNPDYLAVSLLSGACQISVQDIWISVQDPCRLHNHTN